MLRFLLFWMKRSRKKNIQFLHFWVNKDVFQEVAEDLHQNNHSQEEKERNLTASSY